VNFADEVWEDELMRQSQMAAGIAALSPAQRIAYEAAKRAAEAEQEAYTTALMARLAAEAAAKAPKEHPMLLIREKEEAQRLLASVLTVTAMNPWDVISTRLYQSGGVATRYRGPLDCAMQAVRAEGVLALQKGWLAQFARLGPHTILTFVAMEHLRPLFAASPLFSEVEPADIVNSRAR
jgi:hypothetical protein